MTPTEVEQCYETLARQIDRAGDKSEVFLAKLVLLLAHANGDATHVLDLIAEASANLE